MNLPPPDNFASIGWAFVVLVCLIVGLRQGMGFMRDLRRGNGADQTNIHPQPLQVEAAFTPASEATCKERYDKTQLELKDLRDERKKDVAELHEKINKVDKEVGGLTTATHLQNQQLAQISAKIDRIAERK
ncbi:MAG TPA: hypothetical protein PLK78_17065 [Verrucomicrobiota bacterium]|nr:hypothetical protein [Verrucomicrobiota bacterium]